MQDRLRGPAPELGSPSLERCAALRARQGSIRERAPLWPAAMAGEAHPVPSRTRKLSPPAPMVLRDSPWESRAPPATKGLFLFASTQHARGPGGLPGPSFCLASNGVSWRILILCWRAAYYFRGASRRIYTSYDILSFFKGGYARCRIRRSSRNAFAVKP